MLDCDFAINSHAEARMKNGKESLSTVTDIKSTMLMLNDAHAFTIKVLGPYSGNGFLCGAIFISTAARILEK